jgi:ATP-dependent protease ClpP protease subunit
MGGDMSLGLGIYDAIKSSVSQTIMITCGMTASMGTVIAQAPDIRLIYPSTVFLIHEGYISFEETETKTAVSTIKSAKWYLQKLYDIYYSSCKSGKYFQSKTEKQVKSFLRKTLEKRSDWYLEADEVIKYGLADHILVSDLDSILKNINEAKK